jgi:hypothetical protein
VNSLEKLKTLDEEQAKVLDQARTAALQKIRDAIKELSELGLHYRLVEAADPPAGNALQTAPRGIEAAKFDRRPGGFDQTLLGS